MPVTLDDVRAALMPDEPSYGRAAAELGAEALPHLRSLIEGDDLGLAAKATSLATLIPDERSVDVLARAVESEHQVVRIAVAAAVWRLDRFEIGPLLVPLLRDPEPSVRLNAVKSAIREPTDPRVAEALDAIRLRDPVPVIRDTAADALRRIERAEWLSRVVRGGGPLVDNKLLERLGTTVKATQLYVAFAEAALNDDIWETAKANPARYLRASGLRLPKGIEVVFAEHRKRRPWPAPEPQLELVVVRCFWISGRADPDEDPQPPTRFCLEIPVFLLDFIRRRP